MKKQFLITASIVIILFLPTISSASIIFNWYSDGLGWVEGNTYGLGIGYTAGGDFINLYIEPSSSFPNNQAKVSFDVKLYNEYNINKSNITVGDFEFATKYAVFANETRGYYTPHLWSWEYTSPIVKAGASDFSSFNTSSTTDLTFSKILETGKTYYIGVTGTLNYPPILNSVYLGPGSDFFLSYFSIDTNPLPQIIDPEKDSNLSLGFTSNISIENYTLRGVPEPSTLLLLGCGLVGLVGFGRKKFKW